MTPSSHTGRRDALAGITCAFVGALCWGFSATCVSWLTARGVSVLWLANVRMALAGAFFLAVALVHDRGKLRALVCDRRLLAQLAAYAGIGVFLLQISYMSTIYYTNPGTALLLQEMCIPIVLAYACVRGRRRPSGVEVAAMVLAVLGIVAIATQGNVGSLGISALGLVWGAVCAFSMAGYNVLPVRLLDECGSFVVNGVAMVAIALAMAPFVQPWNVPAGLDATGWLVVAGVVVLGTAVAYLVYLHGVRLTGPVRASLIGVFEPLSGAFFSAVWLGTTFSAWDFAGGAAIIAMMALVALRG